MFKTQYSCNIAMAKWKKKRMTKNIKYQKQSKNIKKECEISNINITACCR